ncbi:PRKR-interacting protein 1 homolog [Halyomorpha halys]|uniref:PRKR-interacting protein 1 homolog n=1 Tax=Halyomorpha halys TaxID=286706 RepID=UPI0006D4EEE8|nr:PRKR-interacting protein 1 homolog [Halyomorpha halys]
MSNHEEKSDLQEDKPLVPRTAVSLQRMKLEKLMKNPDKPVVIPERQRDKKLPHVPDFVRNVMGSSAGAGSGEFHVYRHLRRKEYARQKIIHEKGEKALLDDEYQRKLETNQKLSEQKTAKKRAKRLKMKEKLKKKKQSGLGNSNGTKQDSDKDDSDSSVNSTSEDESQRDVQNIKSCEK